MTGLVIACWVGLVGNAVVLYLNHRVAKVLDEGFRKNRENNERFIRRLEGFHAALNQSSGERPQIVN